MLPATVGDLVREGKVEVPRSFRGRRRQHPPRPRRSSGLGAAERIFALGAQSRGRRHSGLTRARHRPRAVLAARPRLSDRRRRGAPRIIRRATIAAAIRATRARISTPISKRRGSCGEIAAAKAGEPGQIALAWILHKGATSRRSPAPSAAPISRRTSPPRRSASTRLEMKRSTTRSPPGKSPASATPTGSWRRSTADRRRNSFPSFLLGKVAEAGWGVVRHNDGRPVARSSGPAQPGSLAIGARAASMRIKKGPPRFAQALDRRSPRGRAVKRARA